MVTPSTEPTSLLWLPSVSLLPAALQLFATTIQIIYGLQSTIPTPTGIDAQNLGLMFTVSLTQSRRSCTSEAFHATEGSREGTTPGNRNTCCLPWTMRERL